MRASDPLTCGVTDQCVRAGEEPVTLSIRRYDCWSTELALELNELK